MKRGPPACARSAAGHAFRDRFGIVDDAAHSADRLREPDALGVDRFAVSGPTMGADREEARAFTRFVNEVIPALRAA